MPNWPLSHIGSSKISARNLASCIYSKNLVLAQKNLASLALAWRSELWRTLGLEVTAGLRADL